MINELHTVKTDTEKYKNAVTLFSKIEIKFKAVCPVKKNLECFALLLLYLLLYNVQFISTKCNGLYTYRL